MEVKMANLQGKIKLSRYQLLNWLVQQPEMTVAMEACGASHHWAREIRKPDHDVMLLPAQHVKAYQWRQKNDYNDAQAIAEASQHGTIRPVPIKTLEQQNVQTFFENVSVGFDGKDTTAKSRSWTSW